jgi:hypothetical protein
MIRFVFALCLTSGCLPPEPTIADVRVTWALTTSSSDVETHVAVFHELEQLDGAYVKGSAGDITLSIEARPEPVRACVQLYHWGHADPKPWCDQPCLELFPEGPEHCQALTVEDDVHVAIP